MKWIISFFLLQALNSFGQEKLAISTETNSSIIRDFGTDVFNIGTENNLFLRKYNQKWEIINQNQEVVKRLKIFEDDFKRFPASGIWENIGDNVSNKENETVQFYLKATVSESTTLLPFGIVLPRLFMEAINAIEQPETGSMIWSIDANCPVIYNGDAWKCLKLNNN